MKLALDENPKNFADRLLKKIKRVYRDILRAELRKKMVVLPPTQEMRRENYSYRIHMLVCKRDLSMALCACKSLVMASGSPQPFIFHDDGSLDGHDCTALTYHFPGAKVIRYTESHARAIEQLGSKSKLYGYRNLGVMMLKLLDVKLFSESEKVIIMDSDILFFNNPVELFDLAKDKQAPNSFNKDIAPAYMLDLHVLEEITGKPLLSQINAGLSVVHVEVINFEKIERWLSQLEGKPIIMHRIEQSLMAMLVAVSNQKAQYLPPPYDVSYTKDVTTAICKHYVGRIRHGFELEGIRHLLKRI